jgi:hypothetical protein
MTSYYRERYASDSPNTIALGVWRGYVLVSMLGDSGALNDFLVCEIATRSWFRFANTIAKNFAVQFGGTDELYFANPDSTLKKVGKLSAMFSPAAGVKNDGDGDAVLPVWETGLYDLDSFYLKNWGDVYLNYDMRDAASDNPALTLSYLTDPASTSYTALSPTFAETTTRARARVTLNQAKYGVAFKCAQANASSDTRIYGIEADVSPQEGSALA